MENLGVHEINVRYFVEGVICNGLHDDMIYGTLELPFLEWESIDKYREIEYERHTVFDNGVRQICLTKIVEDYEI